MRSIMFKWYRSIFSVQNPQHYDFLACMVRMGFLTCICRNSGAYLLILSLFSASVQAVGKHNNNVTEVIEDNLWERYILEFWIVSRYCTPIGCCGCHSFNVKRCMCSIWILGRTEFLSMMLYGMTEIVLMFIRIDLRLVSLAFLPEWICSTLKTPILMKS